MGKITRNFGTFIFAVLVHLAFVGMLVFSFNWNTAPPEQPQSNVVSAVLMTEKPIKAPKPAPKPPAPKTEPEPEPVQKEDTEQKLLEEQRKVEEQRRQEEVVQQKEREAEQLRITELKKLEEKQEDEKKQLEEQQRVEEQKRVDDEEAKRKAEEQQRKKRELDEKRRQEDEQALREQMAAEEGSRDQLTDRQKSTLLQQWKTAIEQKVKRSWRKPEGTRPGMKCDVRVQQIPGGEVINVTITSCNNSDTAFQRSIETAVSKASPLPPPSDPSIFDRDIVITFKPE